MTPRSVRSHVLALYGAVDDAMATFASAGGVGLPTAQAERLHHRVDEELDGLRRRTLAIAHSARPDAWLAATLHIGDLAAAAVAACRQAGHVPSTVADHPPVAEQVQRLAATGPAAAAARVALEAARAAVSGTGPRMAAATRELVATTRLSSNDAASWEQTVARIAEQLVTLTAALPAVVAAAVAPSERSLILADVDPRVRDGPLTARLPGVGPEAILAARSAGRWAVPGLDVLEPERVMVLLPPDQVGPLRAVTLDRGAEHSEPPRADASTVSAGRVVRPGARTVPSSLPICLTRPPLEHR